jgi:NAD-dependent deacetylase
LQYCNRVRDPKTIMSHEHVAEVRVRLASAKHVVVLTGAGVSAPSGIPTFRDALAGLWAKYDPAELATAGAFGRNPGLVTQWYDERRLQVLRCTPNAGHLALVVLERQIAERGGRFTLITQNVDRLHQRAGSGRVVELHGSLLVWRCTKTGAEQEFLDAVPLGEYPPRSPAGGLFRPGVVWFGEVLPQGAIEAAEKAAGECDLFLSLGTSDMVYPAAGLIETAAMSGARTCEINLDETPNSRVADWSIRGRCDEVLPELVQGLRP